MNFRVRDARCCALTYLAAFVASLGNLLYLLTLLNGGPERLGGLAHRQSSAGWRAVNPSVLGLLASRDAESV